jgi:uncharacterized protein YqeY
MTLKARITEDMKTAMRAKDTARLSAIRLLLAAVKQREVDERRELSDADVLAVIDKMVKQRRDSIAQFTAGNRMDLVANEQGELAVLATYQPQQMSEAEVDAAVEAAIAATGEPSARGREPASGLRYQDPLPAKVLPGERGKPGAAGLERQRHERPSALIHQQIEDHQRCPGKPAVRAAVPHPVGRRRHHHKGDHDTP